MWWSPIGRVLTKLNLSGHKSPKVSYWIKQGPLKYFWECIYTEAFQTVRSDEVRGGIYIQALQPNKPSSDPSHCIYMNLSGTQAELYHNAWKFVFFCYTAIRYTFKKCTLPVWYGPKRLLASLYLGWLSSWLCNVTALHCCMCRETCRRRRKQFDSEALQADLQGSSVEGWPGQEAGREGGVDLVKWEMLHFTTLAHSVYTLHTTLSLTPYCHTNAGTICNYL